MKKLFTKLSMRSIMFSLFALAVASFATYQVMAGVGPVTPATGGTNISIDNSSLGTSPAWTTLTGFVISESSVGEIGLGPHTITLPEGWEFKVDGSDPIHVSGNGTDLVLGFQDFTPLSNSISFNVTATSSLLSPAVLTFSNIKVRPTTRTPGSVTMTATLGTIAGVTNGVTSFGTLTSVPGTATKLAFTTQPGATTVYGSNLSTQPVIKSQDQFGNDSTAGLASSNNVTLTLSSGSGVVGGTAVLDIGTSHGNGTVSYSDLSISDVGTGKVFTATAVSGLTSATSSPFDITQKPLTATITASNKTYDGDNTATITGRTPVGLVGADTVTISGGTATFSDANFGTGKTVTASGMTLDASGEYAKYTFDGAGSGTANITALGVTVTANAAQTKMYGEADPAFTYTLSAPLLLGNTVTGALSRAGGENVATTYAINQGTLSFGDNYAITFVPANFSITKRPITVTAVTNTKEYSADVTASGIPTISGNTLKSGDTANFLETYDTPLVGTGKTLTPAGVVTDGNGGANYDYTFVTDTTGIITAKELTVTGLSLGDKVYDGNTTASITGSPTLAGIIGLDDVTLAGIAGGSFSTPTVGAKTVTVTGLSLAGTASGNYTLTAPVLSANITKKTVTVTPNGLQTKVYGEADPAFTYTPDVALIGDNTFTGALTRVTGESAGTYAIEAGNLASEPNYNVVLDVTPVNFTITKRPITVTAVTNTKEYDTFATASTVPSVTPGGLATGDTANFTEAYSSATVGTRKTLTPSGTVTSANPGVNYDYTFVPDTTGVITAKALTVTGLTLADKEYDTNTSAVISGTPSLVGIISPDTVTIAGTAGGVFSDANVGSRTVDVTGLSLAGGEAGNYSLTAPTLTANITAKPIIVTPDAGKTKVYGNADPAFTYTNTPLLGGDLLSGTLSRASGENVGNYAITLGSVTASSNYAVSLFATPVDFAITQKPITITVTPGQTKVYGTADPVLTESVTPGLAFSDTLSGSLLRDPGEIVGVYAIGQGSRTAGSNYSMTFAGDNFTITKATPVVTWANPSDIVYGTALSSTQLNASTPVAGSFVYTPNTGAVLGAGAGQTLSTTFTPTDTTNYESVTQTATINVSKATPVITWASPVGIVYGTALSSTQLNASTPVAGSFVYSPLSGTTLNAGNSQILSTTFTPDDAANYESVIATTTIDVAKATPVITWTTPADMVAGTALSGTQLNATSGGVAGNFVYTPASGNVFTTAQTETLSTAFTPTDTANYNSVPLTQVTVNVVPAVISQFAISGFPASLDITSPSTVTVTGKDQYGNTVTNNSTTRAVLSADNGGAFSTPTILTLTNGVTTTTLTKSSAGTVHLNVSAGGSITPAETSVIFTDASDRTAPVISSMSTDKANYEATNDTSITVTVTEDDTASTVTVNGYAAAKTAPRTWSVTFTKSTALGTHSLVASAVDASGNIGTLTSSYNVIANSVVAVVPTVALNGSAIVSAYSLTQAQSRFASGLQFTTTNGATTTVNGAVVASGATVDAATLSEATTLGAHSYNVIVTSSTGNTANMTVSYQVNANSVASVIPTVTLNGLAVVSAYSETEANARFSTGVQFTVVNDASVTVNGIPATVTGGVVTAVNNTSAKTLGAHTYNVVVTSTTGHTANATVSYQVNADSVTPVLPIVALNGTAIVSAYTVSEVNTRFASGVQVDTTNVVSATVNGSSTTASSLMTVASNADAKTLGAHSYNVIVTSSTGHTANVTITYQVNTDPVVQGNGTLAVTGINTVNSTMTADDTFANGGSWTFLITVPTTETNLALKFGDWVSGANSIATANNMRIYSAQSSNAVGTSTALTITGANTYSANLLLNSDLDTNTEGRQVRVTVDLKVPAGTAGGSYSTNYSARSN